MKRRTTCFDTTNQWKKLLSQSQFSLKDQPTGDDPFDCSMVAVPPTFDLVEQALQIYQRQWTQLDERKIVQESQEYRQVRFQDGTTAMRKPFGWRLAEDRLRLPAHFDYACIGPEPQDDGTGERVLLLTEQSKTSSYERELWKLFASIPSAQQLEDEARKGAQLKHTWAVHQEIQNIRNDPDASDAHLLSRMRMSNRNGLPPPTEGLPNTATIRLECWRRQPKRQPNPDPQRLVLEFRADQTLLDLHITLVEMAEDDLWDGESSGCFFIEDCFYFYGSVNYVKPILDWIDAGSDGKPHAARRSYVGMSTMEEIPQKPMEETRLGEIPMRMGIRYYHACHGDVETAICVVDRRWTRRAFAYPIIHDIWTPTSNIPLCDACQTYTAAFVATFVDLKRRIVCEHCRLLLKIPNESLQLYSAWRDESSLSTSVAVQTKRFF